MTQTIHRPAYPGLDASQALRVHDQLTETLGQLWDAQCGGSRRSEYCESCARFDEIDAMIGRQFLPGGVCDCGDYDPQYPDRSHVTLTDCCDEIRFLCETGTVLDGAGTPDVCACKAGMGCDAQR